MNPESHERHEKEIDFVMNPEDFELFVDRLKLRHFKGREFSEYWTRKRGKVSNSLPPESLWPNIVPTLIVLDEVRERAGEPISILSTYRSPRYNAAVGGEPASFHMRFMAVDFTAGCGARKLHEIAQGLRNWIWKLPVRGTFQFDGGIGLYVRSNFVHIDCRSGAANWKGN